MNRDTRIRATARGKSSAVGGGLVALVGFCLGLTDVVVVGLVLPVAVVVSALLMLVQRPERRRGALTTVRRVAPNPVSCGQSTDVRLVVTAARPGEADPGLVARTRVAENVAAELTGTAPRGHQETTADEIRVSYLLRPAIRGRWTLGPATASLEDPFGLVEASRSFGTVATVTVWPAVVELPARPASSFQPSGDMAVGSRRSSPDDAVLREYVVGDDLRRVHWRSAARRGQLMVRSDEGAGTSAATVLIDRSLLTTTSGRGGGRPAGGEWAVSCAASFAVALARTGHATRVVGTAPEPDLAASPHAIGGRSDARARVLDQCVDLAPLEDPDVAVTAMMETTRALREHRRHDEILLAVIGLQTDESAPALATLAGDGFHGAVVVVPRTASATVEEHAARTVRTLRVAGWQAVAVVHGSSIEHAWISLTQAA